MADCICPEGPKHDERGEKCVRCGGFACGYAEKGKTRCHPAICDCFIEQYPDSPFDLHPEAFIVTWPVDPVVQAFPTEEDP